MRKKWGWYTDFCIAAQPRNPQTSACPSFTGRSRDLLDHNHHLQVPGAQDAQLLCSTCTGGPIVWSFGPFLGSEALSSHLLDIMPPTNGFYSLLICKHPDHHFFNPELTPRDYFNVPISFRTIFSRRIATPFSAITHRIFSLDLRSRAGCLPTPFVSFCHILIVVQWRWRITKSNLQDC